MSKTNKWGDKHPEQPGRGRGRRPRGQYSVRAIRRDDPDLRRIGRALVAFTLAEAEAAAARQQANTPQPAAEGPGQPDEAGAP